MPSGHTTADRNLTASMPPSTAVVATLARLYPFLRPALPRLVAGMLCALGASLCALAIPQVLEWAVNGPLLGSAADGDRAGVWSAVLLVLGLGVLEAGMVAARRAFILFPGTDRKSTRLNSSHVAISYAVFCLKQKNTSV